MRLQNKKFVDPIGIVKDLHNNIKLFVKFTNYTTVFKMRTNKQLVNNFSLQYNLLFEFDHYDKIGSRVNNYRCERMNYMIALI